MKAVRRKPSNEDLEDLYEEFEATNRLQSANVYSIDENLTPLTPRSPRLDTARSYRPSLRSATALSRISTASMRPPTSVRKSIGSRCGTVRPITGTTTGDQSVGMNRPLTAIRGAGYTGTPNKSKSNIFDPLNMEGTSNGILKLEPEETGLQKLRKLQERIRGLVDESVIANNDKKYKKALELGKEAELKEKVFQKQEEEEKDNNPSYTHDSDLTFSVIFNLALQYEENELFGEALKYYDMISGEKYSDHGPKVKINIGNIFVKQRQHSKGIRMYRMALDQLGRNANKNLRMKLMYNMGIVFLQMKNYGDAVTSFETIMVEKPNFGAGFHLVVSNYMLNDVYGTKSSFQELLQIPLPLEDETCLQLKEDSNSQILLDVFSHDNLAKYGEDKKTFAEKCVLTSARLIPPLIEDNLSEGYNWVIRSIKASQHNLLSSALEISKAVHLIKQREIPEAITILKEFEKKETKFFPLAATNLSFVYYLQGDVEEAYKYGHLAINGDPYNEKGFVNFGNSSAATGDLDHARTLYYEAFRLDSTLIEASYNLGILDYRMGHYDAALISFKRIINLLPGYGDVLYMIGLTYEQIHNHEKAIEYYLKTLAINQRDSGVFKKLGMNAGRIGDIQQAYSYYMDSYKCNPSDVFVIKWLAMYLIENGVQEQAMDFFHNGLLLDPTDPLWLLSMASCQKKLGNTGPAIQYYKAALEAFPENYDATEGLVELSRCLEKNEGDWYKGKLQKLRGIKQETIPNTKPFVWDFRGISTPLPIDHGITTNE